MISIFCCILIMDVVNVVYLLNQKIIAKYNYILSCEFNKTEQILNDQLLNVIENLVEI